MTLLRNLQWGFVRAFIVAAGFSGIVAIQYLLKGPKFLEKYGVDLTGLFSYYWFAALVIGVVLGLLRPITRYRSGAILTGVIVGLIGYGAASILMFGFPRSWASEIWVIAGSGGLFTGVYAGNHFWEEYVEPNLPVTGSPPVRRPKFKIWNR